MRGTQAYLVHVFHNTTLHGYDVTINTVLLQNKAVLQRLLHIQRQAQRRYIPVIFQITILWKFQTICTSRIQTVLAMVYNIQNSINQKTRRFENWICFRPQEIEVSSF
jgi:hypothetical protein